MAYRNDNDDDFGINTAYFGPRSTGMGLATGGSGASSVNGNSAATTPSDIAVTTGVSGRKRLRRGGGPSTNEGISTADNSGISSVVNTPAEHSEVNAGGNPVSSTFTASLQSRLSSFNVDSGQSSAASSVYDGGPANGGSNVDGFANGDQADIAISYNASPSGTPGPSHASVVPAVGDDPDFDRFSMTTGSNFSREVAWRAFLKGERDFIKSIGFIVQANSSQPNADSASGTTPTNAMSPSVAATYAHVNSPLSTPASLHLQQQQQMQQHQMQQQQYTYLQQQQQQMAQPRRPRIPAQQVPQHQRMQVNQQPRQSSPGGAYGIKQQRSPYQNMGDPSRGMQHSGVFTLPGFPPSGTGVNGHQHQSSPYSSQHQHKMQSSPRAIVHLPRPRTIQEQAKFLPADHSGPFVMLARLKESGNALTPADQDRYRKYLDYVEAAYQRRDQAHRSQQEKLMRDQQEMASVFNAQQLSRRQREMYEQQARSSSTSSPYSTSARQYQQHESFGTSRPQNRHYQAPQTTGQILARQLAAASGLNMSKKKRRRTTAAASDSDDDGGAYDSAGSDGEYENAQSAATIARQNALAMQFFNTCEKQELMELAGCNAAQAGIVIKMRPFSDADDFKSRTRKQKGVGNMMLETYLEVVDGMFEVDQVLSRCEEIGAQLSSVMRIWQSGAAVTDDSAAHASNADDVGLNMVAISEETIKQRVDASTDPAVQAAFKDYIRVQPAGIPNTVKLKDYQMLGLNWLNLLWSRRTSCILADEMGLGKTIQVISLIAHLKETGQPGPHLVIVPSSTLENWMREFDVFAPDIHVESYYGSQAERADLRYELREMTDLDVVVTTYNIATSSNDDIKFLRKKMDFKVAVFDEGHQLKNSESKKYRDLMLIKADWRLLLTGTPLQNNLQELVSLLSFILPEQFRDAGDALRAIFKVAPGQQANLLSRERVSRAKRMMTPFVLRRKKAQVLKDLPSKTESIEWCDMTALQREVYEEALTRSKKALLEAGDDIENLDDEDDNPSKDDLDEDGKPTAKAGRRKKAADRDEHLIFEDMTIMTDFELHRFCLGYRYLAKFALTNDEWMSAGKIDKLKEMLPRMKSKGDRVLLFSQFTQVLDILEVVLDTMSIKYLKLTGQTNVVERQGLVDTYTKDSDITVFLLSTRAGGLGLNLVAANTVIFYDQDYNPHNDKQAEDRAYRIGQKRDVHIIKLITKGSLEEDMRRLATNKLLLDTEVSGGVDANAAGMVSNGAPASYGEADQTKVEKKIRSSLLSTLKKDASLIPPLIFFSVPVFLLCTRIYKFLYPPSSRPYDPKTGIGRGAPGFQTATKRVRLPADLVARIKRGEEVSAEEVTAALERQKLADEQAATSSETEAQTKNLPDNVDEDWLPKGASSGTAKTGGSARRRKR
ncbi:DNA-dependent ATPase fun30 [Microbotryomycetes sp. JL221]|nr:DNA-dependent ATPase fun30 [Microbotryomycetes sp. JL221]